MTLANHLPGADAGIAPALKIDYPRPGLPDPER